MFGINGQPFLRGGKGFLVKMGVAFLPELHQK